MESFEQHLGDAPLGKTQGYVDQHDPSLLYPIPRQAQREPLGIAADQALPFVGEDVWTAYEVSWLLPGGRPVVRVAEFRIPAQSPHIIESKSFKLYLNSLNQTHASQAQVQQWLETHLSEAAGAPVDVKLMHLDDWIERDIKRPIGQCLDELEVDCDDLAAPQPALLSASGAVISERLYSHLLKSNCPVTGQPDWATVVIDYTGPKVNAEGLLRYIVSYRRHNDFHEHCVEKMFLDLQERCHPEHLSVQARYTRRGGLDINPWRSTSDQRAPDWRDVRQ